jgi:linoleoyl-CoA desaturase
MTIVGNDIRFADRRQSAFLRELRQEVSDHLRRHPCGRRAPALVWVKFALYGAIAAGCIGAVWAGTASGFAGLALLYTGFGLASLLLAVNIGHDAAHNVLCRSAGANRAVNRLLFALIGVDGRLWSMRHVGSHHVFPNVRECDADIEHNPILRLAPAHPWRSWMRWQHLYAPFVYMGVGLHSIFVQDPIYLGKRRLANMRDIRHTRADLAWFFGGKAIHFGLALIGPVALAAAPVGTILLAYLTMSATMSLVFVFLLIGTHFAEEAAFPEPDAQGRLPGSWANHQMATALDWSPTNPVAHFLIGGLNAHAAHHLFPSVSHGHYLAITRMIQRAVARHGTVYNATGAAGMIGSHFRFLKRMGRPPAAPPAGLCAGPCAGPVSAISGRSSCPAPA